MSQTLTLPPSATGYTVTVNEVPAPTPTPTPPAPSKLVHFGATIGGQYNPSGAQPPAGQSVGWPAFIKQVCGGKSPSVEGNGGSIGGSFPKSDFDTMRASGVIPFTTVSPPGTPAQVAAGTYDKQITAYAKAAAAWGHPFWLRFAWEMNGSWYPWDITKNKASDYVAMWQHCHGLFAAAGATNVEWVWCVNRIDGIADPTPQWPGAQYVDWTAFDCYLKAATQSFETLATKTYALLAKLAPDRPMMIGEFGADAAISGLDKGAWMAAAMAYIKTLDLVLCVQYYDRRDKNSDGSQGPRWPLLDPPSAAAAWAKAIADPIYATNSYTNLSWPIPVTQ